MSNKVNVCWVLGAYFQRQKLIQKISESVSDAKAISISEDYSGEEVLDIIKRSDEGIFNTESQNKVIILTEMPKFKNTKQPGKAWSKVLQECPDNVVVIFNNIMKSESPSLFKLVKKIGKVFECDVKISTSEAIELAECFFEEEGKKIDPENVSYLIGRVQNDTKIEYDLVYSNLIKLLAYIGKNKSIERKDIINSIPNNTKLVIWNWFDFMDKKDFHSLMVEISSLKNEETMNNILNSSLPVLRWRFKLLLMVKEQKIISKDSRKTIDELSKINKKDKYGELKQFYSDYSIRGALYGQAGGVAPIDLYTRGQLISILKLIDNFMLKSRYGANECQSELMIEMLFMFICGHGDLSIIKDIRQYLIER